MSNIYIYKQKYILAFLFFNIALFTVVHELQNPLMLSTNALPSRVPRRMKIRKISVKPSPKITALTWHTEGLIKTDQRCMKKYFFLHNFKNSRIVKIHSYPMQTQVLAFSSPHLVRQNSSKKLVEINNRIYLSSH